jgi:catechol 2,3-dioxygenase-like lactoylglutathione lyase family enzyme
MIDALDHLTVRASFRDGAVGAYETLLGRRADGGRLTVGNTGVAIEDHASTAQLSSLVFATASLDRTARLLERRAVPTERIGDRLRLSAQATHQVPIELVERAAAPEPSPLLESSEAASITALDHVVIRTPDPERAVALYGGRLGLDLRLDRSNADWGSRLLFFRCGDLVIEIAHDLKRGISDGPDQLWGLAWRTPDIERCNERLRKAGVEVSRPRNGRRPGSQVFTLQSHTANVPAIVIGGPGRW